MILTLDVYGTLVAASLVLLMGRKLVAGVRPLRAYSIPEPVAGGLLVALGMLALHAASGAELQFDSSLSAPLMLTFFACIGLNANLSSLRRGGAKLALFLGVVLGIQDCVRDTVLFQHLAYHFGLLDIDRTHQHWPAHLE